MNLAELRSLSMLLEIMMPNLLQPLLPIEPDESTLSWACRLARFHTGETLLSFLNDLKISYVDLAAGQVSAIRALSLATGMDDQTLLDRQPQSLPDRGYWFRGERFSIRFFVGAKTPYCPLCLKEQDELGADFRTSKWPWKFGVVTACEKHNILLSYRPHKFWADRFDDLNQIGPRGDEVQFAIDSSVDAMPSRIQSYATRRMAHKDPVHEWLDSQTIEQGVRAAENLGAVATFGTKVRLKELSLEQKWHAGNVGFEIVSKGEESIRDFLSQLLKQRKRQSCWAGPQYVFGRLYTWIQFDCRKVDVGPIRDAVRRFIIDEMSIEPGTDVFGEPVERRMRHNTASLANKFQLHPNTIYRALIEKGLLIAEDPSRLNGSETVDAVASEQLMESICRSITFKALPKFMNATRSQIVMLKDAGYLRPLLDTDNHGSAALNSADRKEVEKFLFNLSSSASSVEVASSGLFPIPKAAEKSKRLSKDIVQLLLDEKLRRVEQVTGTTGYLSLLVDPDEVVKLLPEDAKGDRLTKKDAKVELKIPNNGIGYLLGERGNPPLIKGHWVSKKLVRIERSEVARFKSKYVTLFELGEAAKIPTKTALKMLQIKGIKPIASREVMGVYVFKRSEVANAFT